MKNTGRTLKTTLPHQTAAARRSALPKLGDLMRRKLMSVLMMLGISFALALTGAATAAEKIVFDSALDAFNNEIFIMDANGSNRTNLTNQHNAGGSSLTFDTTTNLYKYVWKTEKSWKGTCRILVVRLSDGTDHFAKFSFK